MPKVEIVLGPPGTGKTTYLLDAVERYIKMGIPPEQIAFFAYTRKASQEASSRAITRFGFDEDRFPYFRTIHSVAFRALSLSRELVMTGHHYKDLSEILGPFTFTADYNETLERAPQGGGLGDRAMAIYSRSRARMTSIEEEWSRGEIDISLRDAKQFAYTLAEYKKYYGLLDFNDFLDEVRDPLPIRVLIVDEAQDLTFQQWEFIRRVGCNAEFAKIAGDDDQAIYDWAGADLKHFLSYAKDPTVLPHSHRLPRVIWQLATKISSQIKFRCPKNWTSKDEEGNMTWLTEPEQVDLKDGQTWILCARNQMYLDRYVAMCRDQGVVYEHKGEWSNQAAPVRAVVDYERLRAGESLPTGSVQRVIGFIPGMSRLPTTSTTYRWQDLHWPFEGKPVWYEAMTGIGDLETEYIRRLRRNGESLSKPGRVIVSTIHGIKGGEADNVLLIPDVTRRVADQLNTDEEKRVWYVATSRAIHNLYICTPQSRNFYSF